MMKLLFYIGNFYFINMPEATSAALAAFIPFSTMAKANNMAEAGPFPVIIFSSVSTRFPVTSAPVSISSKPG